MGVDLANHAQETIGPLAPAPVDLYKPLQMAA
jgi:hypothetical protein